MNHFWFICSWKNQWGRAKQTFGVKSFSTRRALTPYTATEKKMSPISITAAEKNSREVNDYLLTMKLFVTVCFFWSSAIITTAILAGSLKIFRSQVCWYSFSNFAAEITTRSHCILYTTFHKLLKAWHKNIPHKIHEKIVLIDNSWTYGIRGQGTHQVSDIYPHVST